MSPSPHGYTRQGGYHRHADNCCYDVPCLMLRIIINDGSAKMLNNSQITNRIDENRKLR